MDEKPLSISPHQLYARLGTARAPVLVDVRRLDAFAADDRGADTSRPDLTPQGEGLLAISYGLSANFPNDHEILGHALIIYDALYVWCRLQSEKQQSHLTIGNQRVA